MNQRPNPLKHAHREHLKFRHSEKMTKVQRVARRRIQELREDLELKRALADGWEL